MGYMRVVCAQASLLIKGKLWAEPAGVQPPFFMCQTCTCPNWDFLCASICHYLQDVMLRRLIW